PRPEAATRWRPTNASMNSSAHSLPGRRQNCSQPESEAGLLNIKNACQPAIGCHDMQRGIVLIVTVRRGYHCDPELTQQRVALTRYLERPELPDFWLGSHGRRVSV